MAFISNKLLWKILLLVTPIAIASFTLVLATQKSDAFHGVGVLKSADSFAYVNDTVTYHIKVYNPSDFDLHNINVTDELLGFNGTIPFMAANNETGVTYMLQRKVLDTDPNPLVNTVSVEAIDSDGVHSTGSTQANTTILQRLIDIKKYGPEFAHEGDVIKYTIVVTNLADSSIANVTVQDEFLGFSWQGDLSVGESDMFNLTHVVPVESEDPLANTAKAWATLNETEIYAEATWTVDILYPKLEVNKTAMPTEIHDGENVTYTIVTTNTGDTPLFNLTLVDSIYGPAPADLIPASLLPNETFVWSFNTSICGCECNVAIATGEDSLGKAVWASDKAFVSVKCWFFPRSLGYWKTHPKSWPVSEIEIGNVTYTQKEALKILWGANAKDATRMLAAQLIAAKLNRLSGACPTFWLCGESINIDDIISKADDFLTDHPLGSKPIDDDRQLALWLKDVLDAYNNSRCSCCIGYCAPE